MRHAFSSSLSQWWYSTEKKSVPMTTAERERILQRFVDLAQRNIAADIMIED